jgi:hypothetical protein
MINFIRINQYNLPAHIASLVREFERADEAMFDMDKDWYSGRFEFFFSPGWQHFELDTEELKLHIGWGVDYPELRVMQECRAALDSYGYVLRLDQSVFDPTDEDQQAASLQ